MPKYQTPDTPNLDRKDHCWVVTENGYKCVLCGAVTVKPPAYPTSQAWNPTRYEKLTKAERALVPLEMQR